jgi:glycosyltransferase involved in cell wall biosynthesis
MDISVIVTNYNYDTYLARCLRSLLDQTLDASKYEVVLVDDASTDRSPMIAASFGSRVKTILLDENVGLASASNIAFSHCTGRLIVRVDSDDFVHPNFLSTFVIANELLGANFQAFSMDYFEVDEAGQILELRNAKISPIACAISFKSEVLLALGAYKDGLRIFEERELQERFINAGYLIHNISMPLYRYVKHSKSLTSRIFR